MRKVLSVQLLMLAVVIVSCAPNLYQEPERTASSVPSYTAVESRKSAVAAASGEDPSAACLACHNYKENHHPTDFVPAGTANFPFPLYDGRVRCLTCHIENHMGSPFLLRGETYTDRREICFKCHFEEEYRKIYPHIMLDDGKFAEVDGKPVCLVCHIKTPDPRVDRTKDVMFRADVAFLCWRCHSLMGAAVLNQHVLLKPSPDMLETMQRNAEKLNVTIPLVPRDRITCSTCHNPHQKGVITYGPSAKGADEPGRLRMEEPDLCFFCHVM